jgi:hypothetical protein
MVAAKLGYPPIPPTLRRAKATVEARYPHAFDTTIPLSKRVEAMVLSEDELLDLFQLIEVFVTTGYGDWRKFLDKNFAFYTIREGFWLLYDKKIDKFQALLYPKLYPPAKPVAWQGTFAEMREMNGRIPDYLLVTGSSVRVYFLMAELKPAHYEKFCKTYYCLSVYEKLTRDRMVPSEKLERGLQRAWDVFTSQAFYGIIYHDLVHKTPEEFVRYLDITVEQAF